MIQSPTGSVEERNAANLERIAKALEEIARLLQNKA